jgi:hypothetical protein
MIRQNVLLSNANKSNVYNLNNDITLNFPTNLFFKPPQFIELLNLDLNSEINLFGNTNNSLYVVYKGKKHLIVVQYSSALKTDFQFAQAVQSALNYPRSLDDPTISSPYLDSDLLFVVTESSIENVVTNYKIERESFTTAYTITCTERCIIDFNHKDSVGPLLGFGNGIYNNVTDISGTSVQSISAYNYIEVINGSGSINPAGPYPNYNDVNCKMILYNSEKLIIPNKYRKQDTTISLNADLATKQYENIGEVLGLIEDQLNDYSSEFTPVANFVVSYDNTTSKVTISNTTGAKFGIGFDFSNITKDRIMYSNNGTDWTAVPAITNNDWRSVAYGIVNENDILVAVSSSGNGDRIMIAENSNIFWKTIPSPANNYWTSIVWSPELELFAAVASSGTNRIMTSSNGINWTLRDAPYDNDWRSITWGGTNGNKKFVAVSSSGSGNRVMTSSDGITWTARSSSANNYWTSVAWSSTINLFCAVASSGTGNRVMTSPDGFTWTSRGSSNDFDWRSVTWGGVYGSELFVAVASSGNNNRVMTSWNGVDWITRNGIPNNHWTSVTWAPLNKFVAVAASGTYNRIMYSDNGFTWYSIPNSPINIDWNSVIWADGSLNTLVSVGSSFGNNSGSLHYILGLEQKSYYDLSSIISIQNILCYDQIFADDYVLVCSDIVNNSTDLNVIGIGNADNIKSNNIIFAIPFSQSQHFSPVDSSYYRINISASKFSLGYKNRKFSAKNPNLVNFYLRLLSGRHITCTSQYTMQLSFLF